MTSFVAKAADAAMVICAIAVTGMTVARFVQKPDTRGAATHRVANSQAEFAFPRHIGRSDARYQLVVWTDYQCPACRQFEQELATTRQTLGDSLRVTYRYFPLSGHPLAFGAATMAECASKQGKFEQMHNALFAAKLAGSSIPVDSIARVAQISDKQAFTSCVADSMTVNAVRLDMARGQALGLGGTPGVEVGDQLGVGSIPAAELITQLRKAARR